LDNIVSERGIKENTTKIDAIYNEDETFHKLKDAQNLIGSLVAPSCFISKLGE